MVDQVQLERMSLSYRVDQPMIGLSAGVCGRSVSAREGDQCGLSMRNNIR